MLEIIVYLVVSMMIGAIVLLYGRKFYFPIIMIESFLLSVMFSISQFGIGWKGFLIGAAAGIVIALLVRFIYKAGVFLLAAFAGTILGMMVISFLPEAVTSYKWIIAGVFALALGICAVKWCDIFIMLGTSLQGGATIATGATFMIINSGNMEKYVYADGTISTITHLQDYMNNELILQNPALIMGVALVLALAGFLFQMSQMHKYG